MKYVNAQDVLPDKLIEELQKHVQSGYIYVPAREPERKSWGELSGYRRELIRRNARIIAEHRQGVTHEELARRYHLSVHTVRKIVYANKESGEGN